MTDSREAMAQPRLELIHRLAALIDPDEPPGLAAHMLADAVLQLVENRGAVGAAQLVRAVQGLSLRHPRPSA